MVRTNPLPDKITRRSIRVMEAYHIIAKALNVSELRARRLMKSKSIRRMIYHHIIYFVFKREIQGYPEGTTILYAEGKEPRLVPGFPPIKRILLLNKAVPQHFIDQVIIEEKMNGYNIRILGYNNEVIAITRGGYICPYTTHRINKILRDEVKKELMENQELTIHGEIIGVENPYTRFEYPETPDFGLYVFEVSKNNKFLPINERKKFLEENGLNNVFELARIHKNDYHIIYDIIKDMEKKRREGIVLKDPLHRVPPLKYTTTYTNIGDIMEGMKYFFDEGRTYIFPRILREVFKIYEEQITKEEVKNREEKLGQALLEPAVNSVKNVEKGEAVAEEFKLKFYNETAFNEFINYMQKVGILLTIRTVIREENGLTAWFLKPKKTNLYIRNIMETGLSPLD